MLLTKEQTIHLSLDNPNLYPIKLTNPSSITYDDKSFIMKMYRDDDIKLYIITKEYEALSRTVVHPEIFLDHTMVISRTYDIFRNTRVNMLELFSEVNSSCSNGRNAFKIVNVLSAPYPYKKTYAKYVVNHYKLCGKKVDDKKGEEEEEEEGKDIKTPMFDYEIKTPSAFNEIKTPSSFSEFKTPRNFDESSSNSLDFDENIELSSMGNDIHDFDFDKEVNALKREREEEEDKEEEEEEKNKILFIRDIKFFPNKNNINEIIEKAILDHVLRVESISILVEPNNINKFIDEVLVPLVVYLRAVIVLSNVQLRKGRENIMIRSDERQRYFEQFLFDMEGRRMRIEELIMNVNSFKNLNAYDSIKIDRRCEYINETIGKLKKINFFIDPSFLDLIYIPITVKSKEPKYILYKTDKN